MTDNLEFGFWQIFMNEAKNQPTITNIQEYKGEEVIKLAITQLDTSTKHQNKIVDDWCILFQQEKLPIKKVFFHTRISQKIFDAICKQTQLEGLWIKWGVYPSIDNINNLTKLKYLHLGGGAGIQDISVLSTLHHLMTFESSHLYNITDYAFLSRMTNIVDLLIEGDLYASMKKVKIKTLKFLEDMPQLIRLSLCMTSIEDHSYLPILKIKSLKYLELPNDKDLEKDIQHFQRFKK